MTEQQVLDKLDIPDFRHMTKDKVISFASMLSNMDPEVAKEALEQFPEFSKTVIELATDCKDAIEKGFAGNSESTKVCHEVCITIIDSLKSQLDKDDLPFEERKYYIEKMMEAAQMVQQKDSENKNFIWKVLGLAGVATLILGGTLAAVLGSNIDFKLPFSK